MLRCFCHQLQNDVKFRYDDSEVKFQLDKDALDSLLMSMHSLAEQLSDMVGGEVLHHISDFCFDQVFAVN